MLRWTKLSLIAAVPLTLMGAALLGVWERSNAAEEPTVAALQVSLPSDKLIVHEWGTFTTYSGSNGVHLDFRPLLDNELPGFVFDRASQSGHVNWFSKGRLRTRVRMETPVTYFYTDRERTVRAKVEFPKGLLTEFYPPVVSMAPAFDEKLGLQGDGEPIGKGLLDWGEIDLYPMSSLRTQVKDQQTAEWMAQLLAQSILPNADGNHYAAARNTDSAFVHVRLENEKNENHVAESPITIKGRNGLVDTGWNEVNPLIRRPTGEFIEKFLFYRGVGKFDVPVSVSNPTPDKFSVTNTGTQPLPRMIVLRVTGDLRSYAFVPGLAAGQSVDLPTPVQNVEWDPLRELVVAELIQTGLYQKEAQAMVDTWSSSWFTEEGLRLFYLVPQTVTDEILPLTITPKPDEQLRVMVGRVEIMSKSQETELLQAVDRNAKVRAKWVEEMSVLVKSGELEITGQSVNWLPPIPSELVALGRFAEPALARVREISPEVAIKNEVEMLLQQLRMEAIQAEQEARKNDPDSVVERPRISPSQYSGNKK